MLKAAVWVVMADLLIMLAFPIIYTSKHIGGWWFLLFVAYIGLIVVIRVLFVRRRELFALRALMGDELFADIYPKQFKVMLALDKLNAKLNNLMYVRLYNWLYDD